MPTKIFCKKGEHKGDRDEQQDNLIALRSNDETYALFVLADGMGGHSGGKKASQAVIDAAKQVWRTLLKGEKQKPKQIMQNILSLAYDKMRSYETQENISPRSTCVILIIDGNTAHYCHIGDSRLYHFRKGKLLDRTRDHSVVQMLVDMEQVSEEEMGTHEDQGRLLKWIGGSQKHEASFNAIDIYAGDQFLLCSDGLWEHLSVEQMEAALQSNSSSEAIIKHFIATAYKGAAGNSDNISLILASIVKDKTDSNWLPLSIMAAIVLLLVSAFSFYNYYFTDEECKANESDATKAVPLKLSPPPK